MQFDRPGSHPRPARCAFAPAGRESTNRLDRIEPSVWRGFVIGSSHSVRLSKSCKLVPAKGSGARLGRVIKYIQAMHGAATTAPTSATRTCITRCAESTPCWTCWGALCVTSWVSATICALSGNRKSESKIRQRNPSRPNQKSRSWTGSATAAGFRKRGPSERRYGGLNAAARKMSGTCRQTSAPTSSAGGYKADVYTCLKPGDWLPMTEEARVRSLLKNR